MTPEERALELVDWIYRAVPEREAWGAVAKGFSELFGGAAVTLVIQTPGIHRLPTAAFHVGIDPDRVRYAQPQRAEGLDWMRAADLGTRFVRLSDYYPQDELLETDYAREFLIPQGLAVESPVLHVTSPKESLLSSGIVAYRRKDGPPISEQQLGVADRLVPHLKRAIVLHGQLGNIEHQQVALHEVIDRLTIGVLILDTQHQPIVVNRMAARIIEADDGLAIDEHGPRGCDPDTTAHLRRLIADAANPLPGHELGGGGFLALRRRSGLRSYPVMIAPILGLSEHSTSIDAAAVMFVSDPEFRGVSMTDVLSQVYRLTPAEAELAQLLAQGHSLEEAAGARHVTLNTARSQLKQVFAKTETNRQGELLQLVLSGVAVIERESAPHGDSDP